jgi:lipoprotein-releasing system permease protein
LKVAYYIARRYLFSKKSKNVVHLVSYASMIGVAIGTAALIIVLSVFNGFGDLILSLYNSFDPSIKISVAEGKTSSFESAKQYLNDNEILYSQTLEEKVLLRYQDKEYIATLKGVDENFKTLTSVDSMLAAGEYFDAYSKKNTAIIGQGVAYYLSLGIGNIFEPLQVYVPNREKKSLLNPSTAFLQSSIVPVGVFSIQADFDAEYVLTSLDFVQEVLNRPGEASYIEINCSEQEMLVLQTQLQEYLGSDFVVSNRFQQHAFLYKILNSEKLIVFLILSFILVIATFNIIGSLTMLMIDKKNDIKMLSNLGANARIIRNIFFLEGLLTTLVGSVIGLVLGIAVCWLQLKFGFLRMGQGSFVVDYYPVAIRWQDVLIVLATVSGIGVVASWIPSMYISKKVLED